ncbi:retinaldehyde-binding protein 1-like [Tenebrio molitor]|uniref:retinaldehyde-binding protein 1-like n=1 Tax=Tenebrio molitor TaxID=7067 RepID=UPI0036246BE4
MCSNYQFKAETIIGEGRTTQAAVDEIKNWLVEASLPQISEELIVLFLTSCKNDIAATQCIIKAYFRIKSEAPELFNDRDIDREVLAKAMKTIICSNLPVRMPNNTVINFFKLTDTNYRNFNLVVSMKLAFMLLDVNQRTNPPDQVIVLIDIKGVNLMHLTCMRMGAIKKFIDFIQEGMPLKIQIIHVLNTNYVFHKGLDLIKIFMRNDLMALIKPHPPSMSMEEFHREWIPASCLPEEYGGMLSSVEKLNQKTIEQFRELKPFFEAEEKLRSEYKRNDSKKWF